MSVVSVTGTGCISCIGEGVKHLWDAAVEEKTGIRNGLGEIRDIPLEESATRPRQFGRIAAREAMQTAGWTKLGPRDGLILATTTGQIPAWDRAMIEFLDGKLDKREFDRLFQRQPLGDLLQAMAADFHFTGEQTVVTSACAAGTQALGLAMMWLQSGRVDRCLVGGIEVLCDLTVQGFRSLQLLNPETTKPFDRDRKGINLSEGAAFLCLERTAESSPRTMAKLSGFGMTSDGHHMTAPHPEGRGSYEAMKMALRTANLEPSDIDWVHAHGTGSHHNDSAEAAAIKTLFGAGDSAPWVSSTKYIHGHALGAAGLIEAVLVVEALRNQLVLKTSGLQTPDESMRLRHPVHHTASKLRHIMKNTLGFGGTNAAVIFSEAGIT